MNKKDYIKPQLMVYEMESQTLLAGSEVRKASEKDYSEENVSDYRDANGFIYID